MPRAFGLADCGLARPPPARALQNVRDVGFVLRRVRKVDGAQLSTALADGRLLSELLPVLFQPFQCFGPLGFRAEREFLLSCEIAQPRVLRERQLRWSVSDADGDPARNRSSAAVPHEDAGAVGRILPHLYAIARLHPQQHLGDCWAVVAEPLEADAGRREHDDAGAAAIDVEVGLVGDLVRGEALDSSRALIRS